MKTSPAHGAYAIFDRDDKGLARTLLVRGAKAMQLRMKEATPREIMRVAK